VTSYTITITPDDDSATTTTLRLDASGPVVRITDLHLHAGDGLTTGRVPAVDFGLLLRAVSPTTPTPIEAAPVAPMAHVEAVAEETQPQDDVVSDKPHGAKQETAAAPTKGIRARRATTAAKAAAPHKSTRGAKSTGKATKKADTGSATSDRVYRRMPDDFATVYQQAGTAAAVAAHYSVPRHTAHGWIRRLRDQGGNLTNR
jgi:hypothetical protein